MMELKWEIRDGGVVLASGAEFFGVVSAPALSRAFLLASRDAKAALRRPRPPKPVRAPLCAFVDEYWPARRAHAMFLFKEGASYVEVGGRLGVSGMQASCLIYRAMSAELGGMRVGSDYIDAHIENIRRSR